MKVVMTVAGSDSGGGAGIQADLKTFAALRVYGTSAITALTAQNTQGVEGVHLPPPSFVAEQIDVLFRDMEIGAVKTGMLGHEKNVEVGADALRRWEVENLVVDPVMVAKSGDLLLEKGAISGLIEGLLPLARVITPNLSEAEVLSGNQILDRDGMKEAAAILHRMGSSYVIVKGGHLPQKNSREAVVDLLFDGEEYFWSEMPRVDTANDHGTGCTYGAAIASYLARDWEIKDAVSAAHSFVNGAMRYSKNPGKGVGPLHHFYSFYQEWPEDG